MKRFAIVGFGNAGYHCAKTLRRLDKDCRIEVFSFTAHAPANPMLTTYYVKGAVSREDTCPYGSLQEIVCGLSLQLHAPVTVSRVDCAKKTIILEDGQEFSGYDGILISTGARAAVPGFLKYSTDHFFRMRTVEDADALRDHLKSNPVNSALVIGASMVGIKVAELLCNRGIPTTLADAAGHVFPLAAYAPTAKILEQRLIDPGLKLHFGVRAAEITEGGCILADGTPLPADLVVLCIGTTPNLELIHGESGPDVGRALITDRHMETSVQGIFAAGDCCEGYELQSRRALSVGLWATAAAQGACAAYNMLGRRQEYAGSVLCNITRFFGMDFISIGDSSLPGKYLEYSDHRLYIGAMLCGSQLLGMNLLAEYSVSGILKSYFIRRLENSTERLNTLEYGMLARAGIPPRFLMEIGAYEYGR